MKALVVYYSRSGNTRAVAEEIAKGLDADIEELVDRVKRGGPIGWLRAGKAGTRKQTTEIDELKQDPSGYDIVIIGTPVWVGGMCAATRTFIEGNKEKFRDVALFATCGGGAEKALNGMAELIGKEPLARLEVLQKEINTGVYNTKTKEFCSLLAGTGSPDSD